MKDLKSGDVVEFREVDGSLSTAALHRLVLDRASQPLGWFATRVKDDSPIHIWKTNFVRLVDSN
jgi:hypothetical protein